MPERYHEKIQNAREAGQRTIAYKAYEATLTTDTDFDLFVDLGDFAVNGFITNADGANSFQVSLSVDGIAFGDVFTLEAGMELVLTRFLSLYRVIRLLHTLDADYKIVAS